MESCFKEETALREAPTCNADRRYATKRCPRLGSRIFNPFPFKIPGSACVFGMLPLSCGERNANSGDRHGDRHSARVFCRPPIQKNSGAETAQKPFRDTFPAALSPKCCSHAGGKHLLPFFVAPVLAQLLSPPFGEGGIGNTLRRKGKGDGWDGSKEEGKEEKWDGGYGNGSQR